MCIRDSAAYIYSRVSDSRLQVDRPMQGQSPYLINVGLLYDLQKQGFSATILYNQIGERIYLVGDVTAAGGLPDIYEAPRPVLDLQLTKKLIQDLSLIHISEPTRLLSISYAV